MIELVNSSIYIKLYYPTKCRYWRHFNKTSQRDVKNDVLHMINSFINTVFVYICQKEDNFWVIPPFTSYGIIVLFR